MIERIIDYFRYECEDAVGKLLCAAVCCILLAYVSFSAVQIYRTEKELVKHEERIEAGKAEMERFLMRSAKLPNTGRLLFMPEPVYVSASDDPFNTEH